MRQRREVVSEWILMGGLVLLVVLPFVPLEFVTWVSAYAGTACVVVAAYRNVPDSSRFKAMFGRPTRSGASAQEVAHPPKV